MKAVILAAGRGSRLQRLTDDRPKCLNEVGGEVLLGWQLKALAAAGIQETIVVSGYRAEMLRRFPATQVVNNAWERTNMVRSLLCVRQAFDEPLLVSYSDILYSGDAARRLASRSEDLVIAYDPHWRRLWEERFDDPLADAESFRIDADGRILDIGRKVADVDEIQGQYMGLLRFSPRALNWVTKVTGPMPGAELDRLDMTGLLRRILALGLPVHGMPVEDGWCEIDTERDLELANKRFEAGILLRGGR